MPATYNKLGLNFMYPENWKLIDETESIPHVVTLEAPEGSCTWTVHASVSYTHLTLPTKA